MTKGRPCYKYVNKLFSLHVPPVVNLVVHLGGNREREKVPGQPPRQLHGPSIMAVVVSMGNEMWPPVGWCDQLFQIKIRILTLVMNSGKCNALWSHVSFKNFHSYSQTIGSALHIPKRQDNSSLYGCASRLWNSLSANGNAWLEMGRLLRRKTVTKICHFQFTAVMPFPYKFGRCCYQRCVCRYFGVNFVIRS